MNPKPEKRIRFLADEFHSESWSISGQRAAEFAPEDPVNSSYARAAAALELHDFSVHRNCGAFLTPEMLSQTDVLALLHPCDPRWERTTSAGPPALTSAEIDAIHAWVRDGGGLLIVTEYEHEKYGDNLNDLLSPIGLRIENDRIFDRTACVPGNPEWIFAEPASDSPLGHLAPRACFYRAGSCSLNGEAQAGWRASPGAHPPNACVIGTATFGRGRVVVVTDSLLFGDEHFDETGHHQLWLNIAHWLAAPSYRQLQDAGVAQSSNAGHAEILPGWRTLKKCIHALRCIQNPDGSVAAENQGDAASMVSRTIAAIEFLSPAFPSQRNYLRTVSLDFRKWKRSGFGRPDFADSLDAFRPEKNRNDGVEHLVIFPMYTPNASADVRFEGLLTRTLWPEWLDALERGQYPNAKFIPLSLEDFTAGYGSECAVLFPETVSAATRPTNQFGGIFCDREARRLQTTALRAGEVIGLRLFPELECLLGNRALLTETCALWDLIHDQSHSLGDLPFDPFMIRQRAPYWMYAIEELRVDVRAFIEAQRLASSGFPFARYVCWAIVLDRILRFPVTGTRVRNYDALGGQILF